jgi:hypothetical protein
MQRYGDFFNSPNICALFFGEIFILPDFQLLTSEYFFKADFYARTLSYKKGAFYMAREGRGRGEGGARERCRVDL